MEPCDKYHQYLNAFLVKKMAIVVTTPVLSLLYVKVENVIITWILQKTRNVASVTVSVDFKATIVIPILTNVLLTFVETMPFASIILGHVPDIVMLLFRKFRFEMYIGTCISDSYFRNMKRLL